MTNSRVRTRWAAIGAAVAISIAGGGALQFADAAESEPSVFVAVDPVRILDTRDAFDVGLAGPFISGVGQKLDVTGLIATTTGSTTVVPDGATGVVLNVTGNRPDTGGFISVRPGTATGTPATSNINISAGQTVPNAATVQLPTSGDAAGQIDIFYQGQASDSATNILIDVVGYYTEGSSTGPPGADGTDGANGTDGDDGTDGVDAIEPSNIVWVAESGADFTSVQAAINSISGATAANPYLVKIAPGTYDEAIDLENHVDLEGSGIGSTIITTTDDTTVTAFMDDVTIRHLSIENPTSDPTTPSTGLRLQLSTVTIDHVSVVASTDDASAKGILAQGSDITVRASHFTATTQQGAAGGLEIDGSSSLVLTDSTSTATRVISGAARALFLKSSASTFVTGSTLVGVDAVTIEGTGTHFFDNSRLEGRLSPGSGGTAISPTILIANSRFNGSAPSPGAHCKFTSTDDVAVDIVDNCQGIA